MCFLILCNKNKEDNHHVEVSTIKEASSVNSKPSHGEIDLKKIKGEYYLDTKNDEVELLLEFDKDIAFLIESGNMGRLYNKHLLKYVIEGQKMKLYYTQTTEGSPDDMKSNQKIAEMYVAENSLFIDSPYLKNKYNLDSKIKVVKSQ